MLKRTERVRSYLTIFAMLIVACTSIIRLVSGIPEDNSETPGLSPTLLFTVIFSMVVPAFYLLRRSFRALDDVIDGPQPPVSAPVKSKVQSLTLETISQSRTLLCLGTIQDRVKMPPAWVKKADHARSHRSRIQGRRCRTISSGQCSRPYRSIALNDRLSFVSTARMERAMLLSSP